MDSLDISGKLTATGMIKLEYSVVTPHKPNYMTSWQCDDKQKMTQIVQRNVSLSEWLLREQCIAVLVVPGNSSAAPPTLWYLPYF